MRYNSLGQLVYPGMLPYRATQPCFIDDLTIAEQVNISGNSWALSKAPLAHLLQYEPIGGAALYVRAGGGVIGYTGDGLTRVILASGQVIPLPAIAWRIVWVSEKGIVVTTDADNNRLDFWENGNPIWSLAVQVRGNAVDSVCTKLIGNWLTILTRDRGTLLYNWSTRQQVLGYFQNSLATLTIPVDINGIPWLVEINDTEAYYNLIARPFDDKKCIIVDPNHTNHFTADSVLIGADLKVGWSKGAGQQQNDIEQVTLTDVVNIPRTVYCDFIPSQPPIIEPPPIVEPPIVIPPPVILPGVSGYSAVVRKPNGKLAYIDTLTGQMVEI